MSADKGRFLDKLGATQLQDIETSKCCWRGSALQGVQVFQLVCTVNHQAVKCPASAHTDCSSGEV
jgi:hypothetical protein